MNPTPDTATWLYALGLLVLGFALLLLEVFVIPGINIFGILGFLTAFIGVAYAYLKLGSGPALTLGAVAIVAAGVLLWAVLRHRTWQRLVLHSDTAQAEGYTAVPADLDLLVGQTGKSLTPLRPSGRAQFGERVVDVVTESTFLASGTAVEVVSVVGTRVVVQQSDEKPS